MLKSCNIFLIISNQCVIFLYVFFSWRFQFNALTLLAWSTVWRFWKVFAQFLSKDLNDLFVENRWWMTLKTNEDTNSIRTDCSKSVIWNKNLRRNFFFHEMKYCWLSIFCFSERRFCARWCKVEWEISSWSVKARYNLNMSTETSCVSIWLTLFILVYCNDNDNERKQVKSSVFKQQEWDKQ